MTKLGFAASTLSILALTAVTAFGATDLEKLRKKTLKSAPALLDLDKAKGLCVCLPTGNVNDNAVGKLFQQTGTVSGTSRIYVRCAVGRFDSTGQELSGSSSCAEWIPLVK